MDLFDIEASTKANLEFIKNKKENRILELENLIKKHQKLYYNGEAEISDFEFDKLWDELKSLDPINPILLKIGADSGNFEKVKHIMPMGSQEKVSCPEEFLDWCLKHDYSEYLVEYKLDGASLELQYRNGKLVAAITRGDGEIGDSITNNALKMQGVLESIFEEDGTLSDFTGGIRGEVIMTHEVHKKYFSDKANCRNAANGLMKKKDGQGCEYLKFIAYDIFTPSENIFNDEEKKISWLEEHNFFTSPLKILNSPQEVIDYRTYVMDIRKNLEYDIDGLVIKNRIVDIDDSFKNRPDKQVAFKFSLEEAVSVLRSVEWNESGSTYTPVAVFDPVELNGTKVKRASLVNTNLIKSLQLKIGSHILVVKRGEIIPKIISVVPHLENEILSDIIVPTKCNTCHSDLIDEGTRLYCPNKNCSKKILHRLLKWIDVIDIRDLGITLTTELFNNKIINSISDIYSLDIEKLTPYFLNEESISKEKKSLGAEKVFESINNHRKISLSKFIAGFDIKGIGETEAEKIIAAGYDTLDKIFALTVDELSNVYSFAKVLAKTFISGIEDCKEEMQYLVTNNIISIKESQGGVLVGKSFCFTGELKTMKRNDAQNLVKEKGGLVKSSVVKGLSYLVTNDTSSGSSKNRKAVELGITIINEEDFLKLLK